MNYDFLFIVNHSLCPRLAQFYFAGELDALSEPNAPARFEPLDDEARVRFLLFFCFVLYFFFFFF